MKLIPALILSSLAVFSQVCASQDKFPFEPLSRSAADGINVATQPFILPPGYKQDILLDETSLDIYPGNDWNDMMTLNETGQNAGRYLYRTHEVRPSWLNPGKFKGGAVSVLDLQTGKAGILVQRQDWEAVDGIVWTPWGSLLIDEEAPESILKDPALPKAKRGHVYEIALAPQDPLKVKQVLLRHNLGAMAHEGIEYDTAGNIYLVDEDYHGAIYKFVPSHYGDLDGGQLYALQIVQDNGDRTGRAQWVALNRELAIIDGHEAARRANATHWCRPEDLERIGNTLYAALTCKINSLAGQREENRVISITLDEQPVVRNFVKAGNNVPTENRNNPKGFASPDNLAQGPANTLWIVEDNSPSDILVAYPDKNGDGLADKVALFASLKDREAEATGIYFDADFKTLYVNVQHAASGNDKTVRIYRDD